MLAAVHGSRTPACAVLLLAMLLINCVALVCLQECSAGDSAAYQRRNTSLDDVVIISALRTPLTKVNVRLCTVYSRCVWLCGGCMFKQQACYMRCSSCMHGMWYVACQGCPTCSR
jgi:hypothetical protein